MKNVTMTVVELQELLEQASEKGSRRALESIGLHDAHAMKDVSELRGVLDAYRTAKKTAAKAIIHWLTVGILAILVAGLAANWPLGKH